MPQTKLQRTLEPEVMDRLEEALEYDAMDHGDVNVAFVDDLLNAIQHSDQSERCIKFLDVGTGTALIPIELCKRSKNWTVTGIDLAKEMVQQGKKNVSRSGFGNRIDLQVVDAKKLPWEDHTIPVVISNSIVHHIPEPKAVFHEMVRILQPNGTLFVRDLLRPANLNSLEELVELHCEGANDYQRQLFRQSLHAALTVEEVESILGLMPLKKFTVTQTSDRHWTVVGMK